MSADESSADSGRGFDSSGTRCLDSVDTKSDVCERQIRQVDYEAIRSATISICNGEFQKQKRPVEVEIDLSPWHDSKLTRTTAAQHLQVTIVPPPRLETLYTASPRRSPIRKQPTILDNPIKTKSNDNKIFPDKKPDLIHRLILKGENSTTTVEGNDEDLGNVIKSVIKCDKPKPECSAVEYYDNKANCVKEKGMESCIKRTQDKSSSKKSKIKILREKDHNDTLINNSRNLKNVHKMNRKNKIINNDLKNISENITKFDNDIERLLQNFEAHENILFQRQNKVVRKTSRTEKFKTVTKNGPEIDKNGEINRTKRIGNLVMEYPNNNKIQIDKKFSFIKKPENIKKSCKTKDKGTLIICKSSCETVSINSNGSFDILKKRIEKLEQKLQKHEQCLRSLSPIKQLNDNINENVKELTHSIVKSNFVQQYSHITPFLRYDSNSSKAQVSQNTQSSALHIQSPDPPNPYQHNREMTITTYEGITKPRARRQSASMPIGSQQEQRRTQQPSSSTCQRSKSKSNPMKDYRLMDTVHYLAQGEFAPRNDGIKLTPSREAVLSDIIWEDVCRSHWPYVNLTRRNRNDRKFSHRTELQRNIDSLIKDRVTHMERKKRRHYKVMNVTSNQLSGGPCALGKSRDIIVAASKNDVDLTKAVEMVASSENSITTVNSEPQFACESVDSISFTDESVNLINSTDSSEWIKNEYGFEPRPGPSNKNNGTKKHTNKSCYSTKNTNVGFCLYDGLRQNFENSYQKVSTIKIGVGKSKDRRNKRKHQVKSSRQNAPRFVIKKWKYPHCKKIKSKRMEHPINFFFWLR